MELKELRNGSLVKYKDRVCNVEHINGTNNMLYLRYNDGYYCGAEAKEVEPIEIDTILLGDAGFDEEFPGYFKYETDKWVYTVSMKDDYWELLIRDKKYVPFAFAAINYYHQLQMICGIYED